MSFVTIKNKLRKNSLKNYTHVELKVNDMHLIADRENEKWKLKIYHEEKNTNKTKIFSLSELTEYLNAYIITARTQIKILKE